MAATVASAVTAWAGFGIENVKITGQSETSEVDVLDALDIGTYPSLLTLDLDAAKARIEDLPWVEERTLKKLFPDTLEISIAERTPYAHLAARTASSSLIDVTGRVISHDVGDRYAGLPRVVGRGGRGEGGRASPQLVARFPDIAEPHPRRRPRLRQPLERPPRQRHHADAARRRPRGRARHRLPASTPIRRCSPARLPRSICARPAGMVVRLTPSRASRPRQPLLKERDKAKRAGRSI